MSDREKKIYKLWRKYLEASDNYQELCDYAEQMGDPLDYDWEGWFHSPFIHEDKTRFSRYHPLMLLTFKIWNNVHSPDHFNTWWNKFADIINEIEKHEVKSGIVLPEAKEIPVNKCIPKKYTIYINGINHEVKSIEHIESIKPIVEKYLKKNKRLIKEIEDDLIHIPLRPMGKVYLDELEKYLEVYMSKKEGSWPAVMSRFRFGPRDPESRERVLKNYCAYAKRIIHNVERGQFPGTYLESPETYFKKFLQ